MKRLLLNIVLFQAGWVACILGAAHGAIWLAPIMVGVAVAAHLSLDDKRRAEATAILAIAIAGAAIDSGLHAAGLLTFPKGEAGFSWVFPVWIGTMWANFAATITVSLGWLTRWPLLAALLGAISAPGTYLLGAKLGALGMHEDVWISLVAIAAVWAVTLPVALLVVRRIRGGTPPETTAKEDVA